jgi:drug/metabolite transporter superfamily protein YnfA
MVLAVAMEVDHASGGGRMDGAYGGVWVCMAVHGCMGAWVCMGA